MNNQQKVSYEKFSSWLYDSDGELRAFTYGSTILYVHVKLIFPDVHESIGWIESNDDVQFYLLFGMNYRSYIWEL